MISTFSAPVLSVAADVVKDLEGGDALSGLWMLFTKCKESLQDGRRLENISWRMWYREMVATQSYRPPTPESTSPTMTDSRGDFPFYTSAEEKSIHRDESLRPINERNEHTFRHHDHSSSLMLSPPLPSPSPSSCLSISFRRPKPSPPAGQFIIDMLPHNTIASIQSSSAGKRSISDPPNIFRQNIHPVPPPAVSVPVVCLPTLADSAFPRVVVVNPTPHPTPPATPILHNTSRPAQLPSEHLLPPLPSPVLMMPPSMGRKEITPPGVPLIPHEAPRVSKPISNAEGSDRMFFLQQSPEGGSPERGGLTDGKPTASDSIEANSGGSSQLQSKGSTEFDRPVAVKSTRKGKEVVRHGGMVRPNGRRAQITRPSAKRQTSGDSKPRPTFNIGSSSSNGSKDAQHGNGSSSSKVTSPPPALALSKETAPKRPPSPVKAAHTQGRRIVVASSASSEYETDSEDDSWCSEDMSAEDNQRTKEDTRLREAALEAQRQRDMFAKVPKRSYSNLDRSKSGLLTTLLNPDPTIFPPNHPYRTSASSQDITRLHGRNGFGFTPMTSLTTSKSSAAIPQASQAIAQAPSTSGTNHRHKVKADVGYQPKGRPQDQEMDSDSEGDNSDDRIQLSRSVAQERLAALAGRRGIERSQSSRPPQPEPARPVLPTVTSAPIPFGHPYNLPAPAPPSTPRTTRRQMLSTELSESLRRNLLWERQVSKNVMVGPKKPNASVLGNALRPLTSMTAGEPSKPSGANLKPSTSHENREERAEKDDRKRRAMARNRSWANDYHYAGW